MGVTCILNYPVHENQTGQRTVDILCKRLESFNAEKTGTFSVDCETHHSQLPNHQKTIHVLHSSEYPMSCFSFIDSPSGTNVVTTLSFDQIIGKLRQFYVKKHPRIEVKGTVYNLSDFRVKIGAVVLGSMAGFKGLLIEIDYQPCCIPSECKGILKEFMSCLFETTTLFDSMNQHCLNAESQQSSNDVMSQYLEHFVNFKISAMNAASQNMPFGVTNK